MGSSMYCHRCNRHVEYGEHHQCLDTRLVSFVGRQTTALEKLTGVVVDIADLIAVMADDIESIKEELVWSASQSRYGLPGHDVEEFYPPDEEDIVLTPEQMHKLAERLCTARKEREEASRNQKKVRRQYAGKLGPWARGGCKGARYLDVGLQGRPDYRRITHAKPSHSGWYWLEVEVDADGSKRLWRRWCGCNTYE